MEREKGSDRDPAGASMPDQLTSPQPPEAAEPSDPAESRETAESPEPSEAVEVAEDSAPADSEEAEETPQATGDPRVDAAIGRLGELDELPVSDHPGVYERIHERLVDVLGELHQGTQNR
jgi:hypothetical protein